MIIFDLDGTLADNSHRQHLVQNKTRARAWTQDWDAFYQACHLDLPTLWCRVMGSLWANGHDIQIWSGRSDIVRLKTELWLLEHVYKPRNIVGRAPLRMRAEGDYTPDDRLKELWLLKELDGGATVEGVFDDRAKVVAMWRSHGIPCAQVAPGDF